MNAKERLLAFPEIDCGVRYMDPSIPELEFWIDIDGLSILIVNALWLDRLDDGFKARIFWAIKGAENPQNYWDFERLDSWQRSNTVSG